ncbi:MAG: hypothetical protein ABI619_02280 [Betaproteobacteria bacterium]
MHQALVSMMIAGLLMLPATTRADCQQQLQQLAVDLRGLDLTDTQLQTIGGLVDDARRYCWVHREDPAMDYLAKARRAAGIKPLVEEFDWESVPLDSLERR